MHLKIILHILLHFIVHSKLLIFIFSKNWYYVSTPALWVITFCEIKINNFRESDLSPKVNFSRKLGGLKFTKLWCFLLILWWKIHILEGPCGGRCTETPPPPRFFHYRFSVRRYNLLPSIMKKREVCVTVWNGSKDVYYQEVNINKFLVFSNFRVKYAYFLRSLWRALH